jgi:hypothetical protein
VDTTTDAVATPEDLLSQGNEDLNDVLIALTSPPVRQLDRA